MTDLTDERVKELRELAMRAAPGPWANIQRKRPAEVTLKRPHWAMGQSVPPFRGIALVFGDNSSNAEYVSAASPDAIMALCDEVLRWRDSLTAKVENPNP